MAVKRDRSPASTLPIWMRSERSGRGPQPAHDRRAIAGAAVTIADAKGLDEVSMREIARALGTAATSLYRYVAKKEELFDLMVDAVMGEHAPPLKTGDWRADMAAMAMETRALLFRHPWLTEVTAFRGSLGPNNLAWLERALSFVDGLGLSIDEMLTLVNTLLVFVRGYVRGELIEAETIRKTGLSREKWMELNAPYGEWIEKSGRYPLFTRLIREAETPHDPDHPAHGFAMALHIVLDGFAARIASIVPRDPQSAPTRRRKTNQLK